MGAPIAEHASDKFRQTRVQPCMFSLHLLVPTQPPSNRTLQQLATDSVKMPRLLVTSNVPTSSVDTALRA